MKNLIGIVVLFLSFNGFTQLPPNSQILYDSAVAQDPNLVNFALSQGTDVFATGDGESFYLQWFPPTANPELSPLIVTLHGSHGNAFMEFNSWFNQAQLHGCGIIALQWNRYNPVAPLDYFPDDTLYTYIDTALSRIHYPSQKAMLHGFSRGSARSYALIFNDIQSGNNYFCRTIANSGDADLGYPLYAAIESGTYGPSVFAGKTWNLYCGANDTIIGCNKMTTTRNWLLSKGANVSIFIQDPIADHNGFQLPTSAPYKDSMLNDYLSCFNQPLSIEDVQQTQLSIFPNPTHESLSIRSTNKISNGAVEIISLMGEKVYVQNGVDGFVADIGPFNLVAGTYFIQLKEGETTTYTGKLVVND